VLSDSDLDWGQGLYKLEDFFSDRDVDTLHILYNGSAALCEYELPQLQELELGEPVKGWVALSERNYRLGVAVLETGQAFRPLVRGDLCDAASMRLTREVGADWVLPFRERRPVGFAGRSIRIYRFE
jgi:hypothetical protein